MTEIKMLPAWATLTTYKGDTFRKTIQVNNSAGDPVFVQNCSIRLQVRKRAGEPLLFEMSTAPGSGITVVGSLITLSKDVNLAKGSYKYDMEITFPSGITRTYLAGTFIVNDEISTT